MMTPRPTRAAFVLLPQFSHLGLTLAAEPLFLANWLCRRSAIEWVTLSVDGNPVVASSGATVPVDGRIQDDHLFDTVFVFASFDPREVTKDKRLAHWLRRQARFGAEMAGVETGSDALAAAGLLDGHRAAIHWENFEGFQEQFPEVEAEMCLYTCERGRLTCGGGLSVVEMMLAWLEDKTDPGVVEEITGHLLISQRRSGNQRQGMADMTDLVTASAPVRTAIELMQESIEEPLNCDLIAEQVGLSTRQLQRRFRAELGDTPSSYYTRLRLAKAHKLLQQTSLPVTEIAVSSGFASLAHFSRMYRKVFGCTPSADRRQSLEATVLRTRGRA